MKRVVLSALFVVLFNPRNLPAMSADEGRAHVEWMNNHLPAVPAWTDWQKRTGTLPPDFTALPSANFLPAPLRFHDGRKVNMPADWPARRAEIRQLFEKWVAARVVGRADHGARICVKETCSGQPQGGIERRIGGA